MYILVNALFIVLILVFILVLFYKWIIISSKLADPIVGGHFNVENLINIVFYMKNFKFSIHHTLVIELFKPPMFTVYYEEF